MRALMLDGMLWFTLACSAAAIVRMIIGPRAADRLVALNVLAALVLAFMVLRGVREGRALYLDVALVYDIFGFLGLLAVARFLKDKAMGADEGADGGTDA
jgi:multicomponent Na+:H+ antiporter subunit F